jgi:mannitol/fructose-specific phosphotransferase system IIA component (Ntr-type)
MSFWKQFKPKSCSVGLKSASKDQLLREIVQNMVEGGSLSAEFAPAAVVALEQREKLGSTGVGMGVAIPHVQLAGIEHSVSTLSVHASGVEWAAVDGEKAQLFFTVLRPDKSGDQHDPARHLEMMRWISRLARDRDFRCFALQAKTRTELVDLLKEMSQV